MLVGSEDKIIVESGAGLLILFSGWERAHSEPCNCFQNFEEGKKIRQGFKPQKDNWFYLSADYSQIELKLLAHFSEESVLIDAFINDSILIAVSR